jgi:MATE family multidrug resistance protein
MTTKTQELRRTLTLVWPITLGLVGQYLLGLIDAMMVGHHSTVELAAAALVNSLCGAPMVILNGFSIHIGVLVAQRMGRNEGSTAGQILRHGLVFNLALGLLMVGLLESLNQHLDWLHQPADVTAHAHVFLHWMTLSLLPLALFNCFRQYSDGLQKTLPPMLIVLLGMILNTILNWFFIFGHGGAPEWGLAGAGLATFLARTVMFVFSFAWVTRGRRYRIHLEGFWDFLFERKTFAMAFKLGGASALQHLFSSGVFYFAAILMGWLGTSTLAAHQTVMSLINLLYMLPLSVALATSVRAGEATGRGDFSLVRRVTLGSLALSLGVMAGSALFLLFGRFALPQLFTADETVIGLAAELFMIAGIFQIFDGAQVVLINALRGMNDVVAPTLGLFVAYWVVGGSLAYTSGILLNRGQTGVWGGLAVATATSALYLANRFDRLSRSKL